ncbi:MAG: hypothetical protein IJ305_00415 [Oscillospiraceae bacterium]|nr:hypothetical protein [Oscillospiraceae bacterium]
MQKKFLVITSVIIVLLAILCGCGYIAINRYFDTHTWATLRITETVNADTNDVFEQRVEFLKNDTYSLYTTVITIEDITHDGIVTMSFSPAVIDSSTKEEISTVTLKYSEAISFKENESAAAMIQVVNFRYQ